MRLVRKLVDPDTGKQLFGYCDYDRGALTVDRTFPMEERLKTLLHECIHWVCPKLEEEEVLRLENEEWARIAPSSVRKLLDALYPPKGRRR